MLPSAQLSHHQAPHVRWRQYCTFLCGFRRGKLVSPFLKRASPSTERRAGTPDKTSNNFQVVEVDAFASVHDMIHAAIASFGTQATLREIYRACQQQGRIAYKRSGGSRLITHNDHWKSQIRHALYTCDRFARAENAPDLWTVSAAYDRQEPQITKVLVRADSSAACVSDDTALMPRHQKPAAPSKARAKHVLDEPVIQPAPKQKRSRITRAAARRPAEPAKGLAEEEPSGLPDTLLSTPSGSVAVSNKPSQHVLPSSDYSDVEERAPSAPAFQPYAYDTHTASTSVLLHEGEDESSHNDTCVQVLPDMYSAGQAPLSYEQDMCMPPSAHRMLQRGYAQMPGHIMNVHPYFTECLDAHQIVANSTAVAHISTAAPSTRAATASYPPTPTCTAAQLQPHAKTNSSSCLILRDSSPSQPQESNSPFPSCYANSRSNSNHSNSPSPSQFLPSQPSPSPSKSPSMSPSVSPCPRQHPYLTFQPAAQYPSPGERPRTGVKHSLRRVPSVEAESPAESQVYSLRSRLAPRVPTEQADVSPASCPQQAVPGKLSSATCPHRSYSPSSAVEAPRPQATIRQAFRGLRSSSSPSTERQYPLVHSGSPLSNPSASPSLSPFTPGVLRPVPVPRTNRTNLLLAAAQKAQADELWPRFTQQQALYEATPLEVERAEDPGLLVLQARGNNNRNGLAAPIAGNHADSVGLSGNAVGKVLRSRRLV